MDIPKKITRAKVQIILESPFFATLLLGMEFREDSSIKTAATNGKELTYNPEFIEGLDPDELKGLFAHEVMHNAMFHHTRRGARDPRKWNMAGDYVINLMLKDAGFKLPQGGLIDDQFRGMHTEQVFKMIPDPPDDGSGGQGEPDPNGEGWGWVDDAGTNLSNSQIQAIEAQVKQQLAQAVNAAKKAGKCPGSLERLVEELLEPKLPWREILSRFLYERARNDYTWTKPNTRYLHAGLYLPALENMETGKLAFIVDTSGSIDEDLLKVFASEIKEAMQEIKFTTTVIHVDTEVCRVEELEEDSIIKPQGGGGTDFRPGFEYINKNLPEIKAAIYFTDGECWAFPDEPDYPVLWAIYDNSDFNPPFGEVMYTDNN